MSESRAKRDRDNPAISEPAAKRERKDEETNTNDSSKVRDDPNNRAKKERVGSGHRRGTRPEGEEIEKKSRLGPKRAVGLMIGYSGTGYYGMQIQSKVKTIEGCLFEALIKAGAVSEDNADDPVKVNMQRAARTDAGVHAAGNLVSIRMILALPGVTDLVSHLNNLLPPEIRIWNIVRTPNSFNARTNCDSRRYTYFMPSYLLIPPKPGRGLSDSLKDANQALGVPDAEELHRFWKDASPESTFEEDLPRKRAYRVSSDEFNVFKLTMRAYEGTHNFNNFTVGREYSDRSNKRFMKSIEVQDPVVYDDTEWIAIRIHGQSFMLHQIRKMICAAVLITRTNTPVSIISEMCAPRRIVVPKAPALGLLLEHPVFEKYNRQMVPVNARVKDETRENDLRPPIDFEHFKEKMEEFKEEHVYTAMRQTESRDAIFDGWIRSIDSYAGPDLRYLNKKGVIPEEAVLTGGKAGQSASTYKDEKKFDHVNTSNIAEDDEETIDPSRLADMES